MAKDKPNNYITEQEVVNAAVSISVVAAVPAIFIPHRGGGLAWAVAAVSFFRYVGSLQQEETPPEARRVYRNGFFFPPVNNAITDTIVGGDKLVKTIVATGSPDESSTSWVETARRWVGGR